MENRRNFFKSIVAFASGVVAAKVASYVPKKENEMSINKDIEIIDKEGNIYNPLVVKTNSKQKPRMYNPETFEPLEFNGEKWEEIKI